ncbi:MAG TPA: hypothetical protein PKM58_04105 [Pyrinomonadaceae bacterium]|nr:hypothetical protein [Pyrinomonadaceae bacterium]
MIRALFILASLLIAAGCAKFGVGNSPANTAPTNSATPTADAAPPSTNSLPAASPTGAADKPSAGPQTIRDFFELLPEKYFVLEGCERSSDPDCSKARADYVKRFLEVEDTRNGYWKSGCDGAQSCLEMAIFKRKEGGYVVLVKTESEAVEESHFLEYSNAELVDIGKVIVPEFSEKKIYIPPHIGTSVLVFEKNYPEPGFSERGRLLHELTWDGRKFGIKR